MDSGMVNLRLVGPPEKVEAVLALLGSVLRTGSVSTKPSRYSGADVIAYTTVEPVLPAEAGPVRRTARRTGR